MRVTGSRSSREVVLARPEFGPFDGLPDEAHRLYVDGMFDRAAQACLEWVTLTRAVGDVVTTRYLLYVRAVVLEEAGRKAEAIDAARELLDDLRDEDDPVWRAKALSVVGKASADLGDHAGAVAAMAEADWLVQSVPPGTYGHLSASMAVGLALRSINLLEQADETLRGIRGASEPEVEVFLSQELALLSVFWGTSLQLIGRGAEAHRHFVHALSRVRRMRTAALATGRDQMAARSLAIEAYAVMNLGEVGLAAARAEEGACGFEARPEIVETHLLQLVRSRVASEAGDHDRAARILEGVIEQASARGREVWETTARSMLAELHLARFGPHPGLDLWRDMARTAQRKMWDEREARFNSLHDQHQLRELTAERARISEAVVQDALTGLGNRRMLEAAATEGPRWAVFVDLDDFKRVNDVWSHAVGDQVLRAVADVLRAESRRADVLVRYGGDEFLVLPEGDREAAVSLAERIQGAVRDFPWSSIADGLQVTVSVGVGGGGGPGEHLRMADAALLEAKRSGRNRVSVGHPG